MRELIISLIMFSIHLIATPQQPHKEIIPAGLGNLEITFIAHGTLMLTFNNLVIHVDPVGMFGTDYSKLPKADIILITHSHPDHLDTKAIEQIRKENTFILMNDKSAKSAGFGEIMANGDHKTVMGISIEAVPAYNLNSPNHPKGDGNGYVLQFGNQKVYIAGDTENIPEMNNLKNIDIAILPMNMPTMNAQQVAEAAMRIKPAILYPYHYEKKMIPELLDLMKDEKDVDVRIIEMSGISLGQGN